MDAVQPLRIAKNGTPTSSPTKLQNMASPRPLSELATTSQRRNSPSYRMIASREPSPFTDGNSSPFPDKTPPRTFFARGSMSPFHMDENSPDQTPSPSLSPKRRSSIEKLKQASRVKNSNIFALETKDAYDPTTLPIVERPTANRPQSQQFVNNTFARFDSFRKENNPLKSPHRLGHKRSETEIHVPTLSPNKEAVNVPLPASPEKHGNPSPTKSSIARTSMFGVASPIDFEPESGPWSDEEQAPTPRALHRHNKNVTFHADPPIINEYEQQTPEPSVTVGSREGSWESDEFEDADMSFDRGSSLEVPDREDSFDEDLENADITPVVLPEDWTRMSPEEARRDLVNDEDDVFDGPMSPQRSSSGRSQSAASDGELRPLPPLPGTMVQRRESTAERARDLPAASDPAPYSTEDILNMPRQSSLTLLDRLHASSGQSTEHDGQQTSGFWSASEHAAPEAMTITNLDTGAKMDVLVRVAEAAVDDEEAGEADSVIAELADFANAPPRISRESILRKVRGTKYDFEDEDEEADESMHGDSPARPTYAELARMHPDQPIPSRENSRETSENHFGQYELEEEEEVQIKEEPRDDDEIDLHSIPAVGSVELQPTRSPSRADDYDRQSSVLHHDIRSESVEDQDSSSHYSSLEPEAESTPLQAEEQGTAAADEDDGKETLQDAMQLLTVRDYTEAVSPPSFNEPAKKSGVDFMGLPTYLSTGDYDFGMKDYITPSPPPSSDNSKQLDLAAVPTLQPSMEVKPAMEEMEVEEELSLPGTPDSVIQHRTSEVGSVHHGELQLDEAEPEPAPEPEPVFPEIPDIPIPALPEIPDIPDIPERRSTIKTGGKLRARPSATPADFEAMAERRRRVSPVPMTMADSHDEVNEEDEDDGASDESSESEDEEETKTDSPVEEEERPVKRRESRRMKLEMPQLHTSEAGDLGLGLDAEFDRVIKSQKVGSMPYPLPPSVRPNVAAMQQQQQYPHTTHPYDSAEASITTPFSSHTATRGGHADLYTQTQKGYLMRQNTKVVVASNRNVSGDSNGMNLPSDVSSNAPAVGMSGLHPSSAAAARRANSNIRKPSAEQYLKTEPWNGKTRRKSVRTASAQRTFSKELALPLPGMESALGVVNENDYAAGTSHLDEEVGEGVERGRLFVKVVGVKDLELPMPRNDRIYFQLTLDNGLHCVTTADLDLGRNASIGQEFELVVLNDLEFQLTLTTKLPPKVVPPPAPTPSASFAKGSIKSQKQSGFSRFLTSPRKRAERERQEREAIEAEERRAHEEALRRHRAAHVPTAWDALHDLVSATDGAFARAYINLTPHERACFGRQLTVDVPLYNEWALERDAHVVNSVRSKRGTHAAGQVKRPPYVVGKLEVQLLYIPKPSGIVGEEGMPRSMGGAIREMAKVDEERAAIGAGTASVVHEGFLSQQGGDCAHWRRRFFRLDGPRLTAYHEHTHQKRAVINLTKASRLVDDKSTLVADPASGNPGATASKGRRKSAFAEEDEGYQYVEEGFRIRFANGETIDFYADSKAFKEEWMTALRQVVGKKEEVKKKTTWTDLVLAREKAEGLPAPAPISAPALSSSSPSLSSSPTKLHPPYSSATFTTSAAVHRVMAPITGGGTEVRDFTKPPPSTSAASASASAAAALPPMIAGMQRRESNRPPRPPPARQASKSAPTSPVKGATARQPGPAQHTQNATPRAEARTPPQSARRGGRTRDAVKSMIF